MFYSRISTPVSAGRCWWSQYDGRIIADDDLPSFLTGGHRYGNTHCVMQSVSVYLQYGYYIPRLGSFLNTLTLIRGAHPQLRALYCA